MPRPARPSDRAPRRRRGRLRAIAPFVLMLVGGAALWFRPAFTPPIDPFGDGRAITALEPVTLGGVRQWISIRGQDQSKPVLLMLLGAGETPQIAFAKGFQRPLEKDFVVVQWDRAGTGKSYDPKANGEPIDAGRQIADAGELMGLLRARLGVRRVILLGHGEGSYVAAAVAHAHPDLVQAYVGVGQVACTRQDQRAIQDSWLRQRAALAGDRRTQRLAAAEGDWDRRAALARYGGLGGGIWARTPPLVLALTAPEYTVKDAIEAARAAAGAAKPYPPSGGPALPLARSVPAIDAPTYILIGDHDYAAPWLCAERYADALQAPRKRVVWFDGGAHDPFLDSPRAFRRELLKIAAETNARR